MSRDDDLPEYVSGPTVDQDGFLVGEIALPGGLPPDDEDDQDEQDEARFAVPRWDQAWTIADRDGYVLVDPEAPGGFRALTPAELTDAVHAATPYDDVDPSGQAVDPVEYEPDDVRQGERHDAFAPRRDPAGLVDGAPVESEEAIAARGRWAIENGHPVRGSGNTAPDDLERLQQRLDELRVRLSGYTWRDGIDRDQALAERREQLGRWHVDDHNGEDTQDQGEADSSTDTVGGSFPADDLSHEDLGWYP